MNMVVDIASWGLPQWIYMLLALLTVVGAIAMHGKQRPDYNGYVGLCNFLLAFILLAWGGFFA